MSKHCFKSPALQHGAALVEYSVVTMVAILVLVAKPDLIIELINAIKNAYASFTYMLSLGSV